MQQSPKNHPEIHRESRLRLETDCNARVEHPPLPARPERVKPSDHLITRRKPAART